LFRALLLMAHDRHDGNNLPLPQEFLSLSSGFAAPASRSSAKLTREKCDQGSRAARLKCSIARA
jgi:hypothetical protein